jgi:hypothetical protein
MAIVIDASSPAVVRGTANPAVTASFTPAANAMIVVFTEADEGNTFVLSNSASLSFASQNSLSGSSRNSLASWVGFSGSSPSAMTITSTKTGTFTAHMLLVYVITGTELSFTGAHGVAQSNTITLTMTQTGSLGVAAIGDNLGGTDAAGTGCTYQTAQASFGGVSGGGLKRTTADGVNGVGTTLVAGSASTDMSIIAVEVKAPSGVTSAGPIYPLSQYGSFR